MYSVLLVVIFELITSNQSKSFNLKLTKSSSWFIIGRRMNSSYQHYKLNFRTTWNVYRNVLNNLRQYFELYS